MRSVFGKNPRSEAPPPPSRHHALECVPVRNPQCIAQEGAKGDLCLIYPVQVKAWFQGIFKRLAGRESSIIERKLQLDLLGASVWRMIDGKRTVREIVTAFQAEHKLNNREAEISVTTFLRELGRRGLLAMREQTP